MKTMLFALTTSITITAAGTSFYIFTLSTPTEAQTNLANTANTIAIAGATALFGLLDDGDKGDRDKKQEQNEEGDF